MTNVYANRSANGQLHLMPTDMNPGIYDSTSRTYSEISPLNSNSSAYYNNIYSRVGVGYMQYPFPVQNPESAAAMELIPVELDIDGHHADHDRRRRNNKNDKAVAPHVNSRRLAQNRASQRAFRDRKKAQQRELKERLAQLQGQHDDLTQSYESLQLEYSTVKRELETLQRGNHKHESVTTATRSCHFGPREWEESRFGTSSLFLFDVLKVFGE